MKVKRSNDIESILLTNAFNEFELVKMSLNKSPSTIRNYRQSYEYFKTYNNFNDNTTLDEINSTHVYRWINEMKIEGKKPTTINHYVRDVRAFLYWCMDSEREYLKPFKVQEQAGQEESLKMFDDDDIIKLLEKPRKQDNFGEWRTWAIVNWVLGTGNRASTICEVRMGDISFSKREITLRHTKNKRLQVIPLSSSLETAIKEYIRVWRQGVPEDSFLFPNTGDEQLTRNALSISFKRYCWGREVKRTNIHGLRHNFACMWIRNGGGEYQLQEILGHSDLAMVRHYVKLFSEDLKKGYDNYSALDNIKKSGKRTQKVQRTK